MKYKTKPSKQNTRQTFNAWQIATKGGKLSRVSIAKYNRACVAAFRLNWLNDYAEKVAQFDNDSDRYTEEKSAKMARRLQELEDRAAFSLSAFGLSFLCCSHLYGIQDTKTQKEIYIRK